MDALKPSPLRTLRTTTALRRERGYVLLLTLIALVVLLLGALFTLRGNLLQNVMTGNTAQRQKNVQVGDLALRQVQQVLISTIQSANTALDISAAGQPWFYTPTTNPWPLPGAQSGANANFWNVCLANKTCDTLSDMASTLSPPPPAVTDGNGNVYQILVTVTPTFRPSEQSACNGNSTLWASYYAVFMNIREANGTTAANIQSVIKLCTTSS